jgi:hypothetical protein
MPLTYPPKSKIGTSHQVELYQPMNSLTSSCAKLPGRGLRGSMTEYMVVKDFRQPSTTSPMCWAWSCRSTIALRRLGSAHKEDASFDTFSKAAIRSATRRFSSAGCKQVPGRCKFIKIQWQEKQQEFQEGLQETYTSTVHKLIRWNQQGKSHTPSDA